MKWSGLLIVHLRNIFILLVLSLVLFLPGIEKLPPLDRDEARFAQASKQMLETGDYIDIRFQETPRYKKPAGAYWIQAASVQMLSPNDATLIWAYRIPSVIAAIASVFLTYAIACLFLSSTSSLFAGILLAASFLLNAEAHMAKTDALLLVSILISQYGLARIYKGDTVHQNWLYFWSGIGIGILLKGPIVPLIISLTILGLWYFDRNMKWVKALRLKAGVLISIAISLPWIIAVQIRSDGSFLRTSIGGDLLPKLMGGMESHGMPPGYYLLIVMITFWPGSLFIWPSLVNIIKTKTEICSKFLIAWVIPTWILFEIVPTKLPHYILPVYPALAIMTAKWMNDFKPTQITLGSKFFIALWLIIGCALIVASILLTNLNREFVTSLSNVISVTVLVEQIKSNMQQNTDTMIIALTSVIFLLGSCIFLWNGRLESSVISALCLAGLFFIPLTYSKIPAMTWAFPSLEVASFLKSSNELKNGLISIGYHEPSLIFLTGTDTYLTDIEGGVSKLKERSHNLALIDRSQLQDFRTKAKSMSLKTKVIKTFDSFNYSKGRVLTLDLLKITDK